MAITFGLPDSAGMTNPEQVRARLSARRSELSHRATRVDADLQRKGEPLSPDFAEQATQRENDEVLGAIGDSARQEIAQIDAALARLEQQGLIESEWGVSENNRRAKFYVLTRDGKARLKSDTADWKRFSAALEQVLATPNLEALA